MLVRNGYFAQAAVVRTMAAHDTVSRRSAMRRLLAFVIALAASAMASAAPPLLAPAELSALLARPGLRVIDIRDQKSYGDGHIQGAAWAAYGSWRGPASNPGELPAPAALTKRVQSLGLTPDTHAVIVSAGEDVTDFGAAARVYWTLKLLGLKDLSILNGGMAAWVAAGLPVDRAPVAVAASAFEPRIDASLMATREQALAAATTGSAKLVDARPAEFYRGETRHPAAKVPGTLRGAVNVEHASWFKPGTTTFVSADEARRIAAATPIDPSRDTISFCNTGHWAATNWFAMSEVLGQKNVRLYAGSMVDGTQAPEVPPMDHVPNRFGQLVIDWKLWVDRTFN
jgi:thiosulfate/3-mercaptopyruvate sulfurtransferase